MALAVRSDKPVKGGKAWLTGEPINETPLEGDFSAIYTQVNGNLDNSNIAAGAAIVGTKLAAGTITATQISGSADIPPASLLQTAGAKDGSAGLDADIVQSYADVAATYQTVTDPGESGTVSLPEHLEDEWERARYVIGRNALGVGAAITDGTTAAAWFDRPVRGPNLVLNPLFLDSVASGVIGPYGWDAVGPPTSIDGTATTLDVDEGEGKALVITASAPGDGIQQTIAGVKASTRYLIEVRVKPTANIVTVTTTGGTGTFGNLDIDSASGGSAWETISGVIETTVVPADIVINVLADNAASVWEMSRVQMWELNDDIGTRNSNGFVQTITDTTEGDVGTFTATLETATTVKVVVPGPGYYIKVDALINVDNGNLGNHVQLTIQENSVDVAAASEIPVANGATSTVHLHYALNGPAAGTTYTYRLSANEPGGGTTWEFRGGDDPHRITVQLLRQT